MKAAVISATEIKSGFTGNVIPETAYIQGTTRTFDPAVQDIVEERMRTLATSMAEGFGMEADFDYQRRYCPTINSAEETGHAIAAAQALVGAENVNTNVTPHMGAEDFGWMLQARPGCYIFRQWQGWRRRLRSAQPELRLQRQRLAGWRRLLGAVGADAVATEVCVISITHNTRSNGVSLACFPVV